MGQVCSSGAVAKQVTVARDPEDQELDEVEMNETKIPDFDSFFERAAAPLNEMVEIHNGIYLSDENLKQAAAAMQGETQLRIVIARSVTLEFWHFDGDENEVVLSPEQVEEKVNVNLALKAANDKTKFAVDQLNESLADASSGSPSQIVAKRGRLLVTKKGDQDALARSVNIALFSLRKELAKAAHIASLSEAVKIFFKEVSKCEDISALSVKTDENGAFKLMNGDKEFDLKELDKLSKPATQFRDALVELMENVQTAATSVPELAEQSSAFATEAQDFPAKVPEAAKAADLGFSEVPSALKNTASNVKALGNGPHIAKSTTAMIKYAGTELAQAISKPAGV